MAQKIVEINECDRCGKGDARTWIIEGPEGGRREIELCDRHGSGVANAFALARALAPPARVRRARVTSRDRA